MVKGALHTDSLQGKTIVVTGGGTGLGKAMSTYFSSLGANLVISSRKLDVLTGTAAEISKQTGNPVLPVACDVRNEDDIQKNVTSRRREVWTSRYLGKQCRR